MELDIKNMTLYEYLKYEAEKERQLWRNVQSKRSPTKYEEAILTLFTRIREAKVDDCDEGNMDDIWDIMVEDVERLRQLLTPTVHILLKPDHVVQPYMPLIPFPNKVNVVREKEPDNDVVNYVAPATKSILDELLEEFGDEILNVTVVDEEEECNPAKDIEELERLLANDPQTYFMEIQSKEMDARNHLASRLSEKL
ncbi:hypothetical protein Tco_0770384 [Tanacetum coccineum]|uniref:Uncharacterized protein n=1 Tax=Tanacetum coccineum TaxID=301880 RepID=A0ABQ4ZC38_9ASTR